MISGEEAGVSSPDVRAGGVHMVDDVEMSTTDEESQPADIQTRIAEKVRSDSRERAWLTGLEAIEALFTDDDPDVKFEEMMQDERFADIKWVRSPTGQVLFYSDQYLTPERAEAESAMESALASVSERVRADSKNSIALTPMDVVVTLIPEALREHPDAVVERMSQAPKYQDVKKVVGPTGMEYLHSDEYISGSYARILARAEANDPLATMAETIREESRVYPRVTGLASFAEPVFNIDPARLNEYAEQLLSSEEYSDIQKTVVSNGAVYLFSNRYLHPKLAARQAEDTELGDELNP
jgi:hypothetical protein